MAEYEKLYATAKGKAIGGLSLDDMGRDELQWRLHQLHGCAEEEFKGATFNIYRGECQRRLNEISNLVMNRLSSQADLEELHRKLSATIEEFSGRATFEGDPFGDKAGKDNG